MAHILSAVQGTTTDHCRVTRALVSVSDKTGIVDLCTVLQQQYGVALLSTGGTAQTLRTAGLTVTDVADHTGAPEGLDGRVKTLHPKIHGGLLAVRGNAQHDADCAANGIVPIDMTILNLYPFEATMQQEGVTFAQCMENIDIGGPSMLRSTAKNHVSTSIVTAPEQYGMVLECLKANGGCTTLALRKRLAAQAFALSASYDSLIATYFSEHLQAEADAATATTATTLTTKKPVVTRVYQPEFPLKYGCNPHQTHAQILSRQGHKLPFTVLNGVPGYINLLDAANAWQLVVELQSATGLAAAASFKHVSPAGAAVAVPLTDVERQAYEWAATDGSNNDASTLTPVALAYVRARNADPLCSFGDFCAVSDVVDEATAKVLKREVSDGIVAPGYTPEALTILSQKKGGKYILLQATPDYDAGDTEYRDVYGMCFAQTRHTRVIGLDDVTAHVTTRATVPAAAARDLMVASICVKYTQSNSVGFCWNGQLCGVGAGQQSRVDCVKLAGRKVQTWYLRQHPKVLALPFKEGSKRQDRVNARVRYIEGDFTKEERVRWEAQFTGPVEPLTEQDKQSFMATLTGVSLGSDAFFPFRDSIDHASKLGVSYVAQPGGSVQDAAVTEACDEYGMAQALTGVRLFHH